jgi:hypothetical protein
MDKEQYYFPTTIEELSIGMEVEVLEGVYKYEVEHIKGDTFKILSEPKLDSNWMKQIVDFNFLSYYEEEIKSNVQYFIENQLIRIPYLTSKDIEDGGFRLLKDYTIEQEYQTEIFEDDNNCEYWWELMIDDKKDMTKILIEHWRQGYSTSTIFQGIIKNKQDFKKLLIQLGIKN